MYIPFLLIIQQILVEILLGLADESGDSQAEKAILEYTIGSNIWLRWYKFFRTPLMNNHDSCILIFYDDDDLPWLYRRMGNDYGGDHTQ